MTLHPRRIAFALSLLLLVPGAHAASDTSDLQNRGHDPFFQISSAIPDCPGREALAKQIEGVSRSLVTGLSARTVAGRPVVVV